MVRHWDSYCQNTSVNSQTLRQSLSDHISCQQWNGYCQSKSQTSEHSIHKTDLSNISFAEFKIPAQTKLNSSYSNSLTPSVRHTNISHYCRHGKFYGKLIYVINCHNQLSKLTLTIYDPWNFSQIWCYSKCQKPRKEKPTKTWYWIAFCSVLARMAHKTILNSLSAQCWHAWQTKPWYLISSFCSVLASMANKTMILINLFAQCWQAWQTRPWYSLAFSLFAQCQQAWQTKLWYSAALFCSVLVSMANKTILNSLFAKCRQTWQTKPLYSLLFLLSVGKHGKQNHDTH